MPSSNVEVIEIGIPGPPGAGVSAAEKASFVTVSGANVFTDVNEFRKNSTAAQILSSGPNTTDRTRVTDTTNKEEEYWNGAKLRGFSDAGATETWSIDSATGTLQLDSNLQVDGGQIKGEQLWLSFLADGGGSTLTTGIKFRYFLPYNMAPFSDGTDVWRIGLDQTGSVEWDLWMAAHGSYPPTSANRITGTVGSQNPRVASALKASGNSLTGWTTSWLKGYWLFGSITSVTAATWSTLGIHIKKT